MKHGQSSMDKLAFDTRCSLVSQAQMEAGWRKLQKQVQAVRDHRNLKDEHASLVMPDDATTVEAVNRIAKTIGPVHLLIVVGIGGSNLGTWAAQEAILGKFYNTTDATPKILYCDTVDADSVSSIQDNMEAHLKKGNNVLLSVVSKSGSTTETIANFEVLLQTLQQYRKDYKKWVVATTDHGSHLWNLAMDEGYHALAIPKLVGGRYSAFSACGIFPLAMLGLDIAKLRKGATDMRRQCSSTNLRQNIAAQSAIIQYTHYTKGINVSNLFVFSNDLEMVGKWYRQLMGESIGKDHKRSGKKKLTGITPTVAVGSTDLHSMVQLYLGGPHDKFTTFVTVPTKNSIKLPHWKQYDPLVKDIQGKNMGTLMGAILKGVKTAYANQQRPFCEIKLPAKDEYSIGALLQFKMIEMMYLGALLNVNPFDQENVEAYKKETRRILRK
ncbi:hypothetical protein CMO91_06260 [Candidatus Woesearchaeota archaeon]|nr:hypothetical protein [Candidatus Woesearchaeota archaeon]